MRCKCPIGTLQLHDQSEQFRLTLTSEAESGLFRRPICHKFGSESTKRSIVFLRVLRNPCNREEVVLLAIGS